MRWLFCFLFLSFLSASHATEPLPIPFCYFENLYFQPPSSTFYVVRNPSLLKRAIRKETNRGYSFKHSKMPLKRAKTIPGTTLFLFEGVGSTCCTCHFFHILEHIVGDWAFYGDQHGEDVQRIVIASAGENTRVSWEGPNQINQHLLSALFPHAKVQTWPEFQDSLPGTAYCFERAITSDRSLSYCFPECWKINRMLGIARHFFPQEALKHLADRVHAYAHTEMHDTPTLRVTYLKRALPRALDPPLEEKLLASIRELDNVSLRVEDFALLPFKQQINIIGNTDLLISVHGNGLSHTLFLPPDSKVIEIFPPNTHTVDYRIFAEARGFDYTCILSDRGILSQQESYEMGAVGNFASTIYTLDIDLILSEIKNLSQ